MAKVPMDTVVCLLDDILCKCGPGPLAKSVRLHISLDMTGDEVNRTLYSEILSEHTIGV